MAAKEEQKRQEQLAREERAAESRRQATEAAERAELQLRVFAEQEFSKVSIDPTHHIHLARSLRDIGMTVELRGNKVAEITSLFNQKSWDSLAALLTNRDVPLSELQIVDAVAALQRNEFQVLLRSQRSEPPPKSRGQEPQVLYWITFSDVDWDSDRLAQQARLNTDGRWDRHPDGRGILHRWKPMHGLVVVVPTTERVMQEQAGKWNDEFARRQARWRQLDDLGEMDLETIRKERDEMIQEAYDWAIEWADAH